MKRHSVGSRYTNKEALRTEKPCYAIEFSKDMVNSLLKKKAIRCSGKLYPEEHRRKFEIKNDIFKVGKSPVDDNKLVLTVNRQPIGEWFKEQWEKLRQGLRQSAEELRKKQRIQVIIPFYIYKNQLNSRILYSDRDNSFQDIKEKKKRYVYFISENVGNFQTDTRDIIVVLTHIAWTTIATYASKVSYDLHLNVT